MWKLHPAGSPIDILYSLTSHLAGNPQTWNEMLCRRIILFPVDLQHNIERSIIFSEPLRLDYFLTTATDFSKPEVT